MSKTDIDDAFAKMLVQAFASGFEDRIGSLVRSIEAKEIGTDEQFIKITTLCTEFTDAFQRTLSYLIIKKFQTGIETSQAITRLLDVYLAFYDELGKSLDWNTFPIVSPYDKLWDVCYGIMDKDMRKEEISRLLNDPEK